MTEQPTTAEDLAELVESLARQRDLVELAKGQLKIAEKDLETRPEWQAAETCRAQLRIRIETVRALEDLVRADALKVARKDGTKAPAPGVQVTAKVTFEIIDRTAATAWARTNLPLTLVLDDGAFGKSVMALPTVEAQAVPGISVTVDDYGQVRISTKLHELYPTAPAP